MIWQFKTSSRCAIMAAALGSCLLPRGGAAQTSETPIRIFGYFQNTFLNQEESRDKFEEGLLSGRPIKQDRSQNSFSTQQLNLFFQKDIDPQWRAFVNFEFLNNFSSSRAWGDADLEEAWVRYRRNDAFSLKIGLLLPTFNNLNEIKNRTPLLPYIIRPIIYESAFREFIAVEEYTPQRAFLQAYGFLPAGPVNFDYAVFLGNSPNISTLMQEGQSGRDTTSTFLVGGRFGLRYGELKIGISGSRENDNLFQNIGQSLELREVSEALGGDLTDGNQNRFAEIPRTRIGADLSYHLRGFSFESELLDFQVKNESEVALERNFYYATLGYRFTEELYIYGTYWDLSDKLQILDRDVESVDIEVWSAGLAYNLNDRITLKAQYAIADVAVRNLLVLRDGKLASNRLGSESVFLAAAASVRF